MVTSDLGVKLSSMDFMPIPEEVSLRMVEGFSEEEVKVAVWMCEGSKSPSPNGFNFNFIKSNGESLKKDHGCCVCVPRIWKLSKGLQCILHCSCS